MIQKGLVVFFFFAIGLWTADGVFAFRAGATGQAWVQSPPIAYFVGCGWGGHSCEETLLITAPAIREGGE